MAATDRRQITIIKDQMHKQFQRIERNMLLITSNSGDNSFMRNTWLPGGTMSTVWGKCQQFTEEESIYSDKIG